MDTLDTFFNNTTSQFYVVLTGTSSFMSGLMMFVEWLHYTYFGISIVDRLSALLFHLFPFLVSSKKKDASSKSKKISEAKAVRNSLMLFRGAEYNRYYCQTGKEPLTEYDVTLTSLEFQSFFICDLVAVRGIETGLVNGLMLSVWKEPDRQKRIEMAHKALENNPNCVVALILLAEEEAPTILEVEEQLRLALKAGEATLRVSSALSQQDPINKPLYERSAYLHAYVRVRLAMCARKLGKLKEAAKMYRDLLKDDRALTMTNVLENLVECLLEMQSYSEAQQLLSKQDEMSLYKSTILCYTIALLKAKAVVDKFCADAVSKRGPNAAEMVAVDAVHCAVELNPHVPKYLLELKTLVLPPEHLFRRGDSEAIAYAFHHLQHWKRVEGALGLLATTWEGTFRRIPFPLERGHHFHAYPSHAEAIDRQLLPPHHEVSVFPQRETPFFMVFTGVLCFSFMTLTVIAYHFPRAMTQYAKAVTTIFLMVVEKLIPSNLFGIFS